MNKVMMMVVIATSFAITACGNDANTPANVEDQLKAVRGSKPTPDQLAAAMKGYKGLAGAPPTGGGTPPATSGAGGAGAPKH